jgi:hypothetical protein
MFSSPRPNLIVSENGFSVEVLGLTGVEYREGERKTFVDSEILATKGIAIFSKSIKRWDTSLKSTEISLEEKQMIIKNIADAIAFMGEEVQVM